MESERRRVQEILSNPPVKVRGNRLSIAWQYHSEEGQRPVGGWYLCEGNEFGWTGKTVCKLTPEIVDAINFAMAEYEKREEAVNGR
jgi:hypothetical protein